MFDSNQVSENHWHTGMSSNFQKLETFFIGTCLEGFFWGMSVSIFEAPSNALVLTLGLYTAIFTIHVHHYISKEEGTGDKKKKNIFYCHCALYVLSSVTFAFDFAWIAIQVSSYYIVNNGLLFFSFMLINSAVLRPDSSKDQYIVLHRCDYEYIIRLLQLSLAIHPSTHSKPSI